MGVKNPAVDRYIAKSADFARPILKKIRELFHEAHPQVQEEMKWNFPHFMHKGILGSMAAFKHHVSFGFWKASLMTDPLGILHGIGDTSMGGGKLSALEQLPPDRQFLAYVREAVALNESGVKVCKPKKPGKAKAVKVPDDLVTALKKNTAARKTFASFTPSHQREYCEWITEAKQEATRLKRLQTAIEWMAAGKSRHWKYQRK